MPLADGMLGIITDIRFTSAWLTLLAIIAASGIEFWPINKSNR
jgi:hypothetical protein